MALIMWSCTASKVVSVEVEFGVGRLERVHEVEIIEMVSKLVNINFRAHQNNVIKKLYLARTRHLANDERLK